MLRILHLSDLHFGWTKEGGSAHRFVDENNQPDPKMLAEILLRDAARRGEVPDAVIISGDLAWSGQQADYVHAARFVRRLRETWNDTQFVMAPGNHDVDLSAPLGRQQEAFVAFLRDIQQHHFTEQYPLFELHPDDRRLLVAFQRIRRSDEDDLLVVAVNSAAYIQGKDGIPVGFALHELRAVEDQIGRMGVPPRALRLFVLHHALFPFAEPSWQNTINPNALQEKPDETIVANSATLQRWLALHSFHVVLHGHKHTMHGRKDVLWRQDDPPVGRQLFVVAAGSSGVELGHLAHHEPLSFNQLTVTRLARARWSIDVSVRHIVDSFDPPKEAQAYAADVGAAPPQVPLVFHAEGIEDCHRAIQRICSEGKILRDFISVVEDPGFSIPRTARFRGKPVTQELLDRTFDALHPEYKPTSEWKDLNRMESVLREASPRAQFTHGPRLFGKPLGADESPMVRAVGRIKKDLESGAYASLYRPEIDFPDAKDKRTPPLNKRTPHLMSVQFILDGPFLDAVTTFRKIELSYWWVVNMYEIGMLLRWAAERAEEQPKPRRITFFAALAEWKSDPEAASVTDLDGMGLDEMTQLVVGVCRGDQEKKERLRQLLLEKHEQTNDNNLDPKGLGDLGAILDGYASAEQAASSLKPLANAILTAASLVRNAMAQENPTSATKEARTALERAIRYIDGSVGDASASGAE